MTNATLRLLERVAAKIGKTSDYALAKALDAPHQRISNYRHGRTQMDDDVAIAVAEFLGDDPAIVLAEIHVERAKSLAAKKHWNRIAKLLRAEGRIATAA